MTSHTKSLEELIEQLPPHSRDEVRDFAEFLLTRQRAASETPAAAGSQIDVRQFFGVWDSGDENSADNERIDADLAREYANTHEADG